MIEIARKPHLLLFAAAVAAHGGPVTIVTETGDMRETRSAWMLSARALDFETRMDSHRLIYEVEVAATATGSPALEPPPAPYDFYTSKSAMAPDMERAFLRSFIFDIEV